MSYVCLLCRRQRPIDQGRAYPSGSMVCATDTDECFRLAISADAR